MNNSNPVTNFSYDPERQGYDTTLWKTLSGVPAVVGINLVLNADTIVSYADLYGCDLTMRLKIPTSPAAGDIRQFGLASVGMDAFIVFDITDDTFNIYASDGNGNTKTVAVLWNTAWAAANTDFEIRWRGTYADFFVNGVHVTSPADPNGSTYRINTAAIPKGPLAIYFKNANADNFEVVSMNAKNIQTFI